jgi:hypothetical protein
VRLTAAVLVVVTAVPAFSAPARKWQTGTWRDVQVVRPKIVFGVTPAAPGTTPQTESAMREIRIYVIETDEWRLELKETTTADAPRLNASVGDPVTFALEKDVVYIKDDTDREHKLAVTKKTSIK